MKEKIYAIPVNDAFSKDCECPLCVMYKQLEDSSVEYTMGPSYMEGDIREKTDKMGFCEKHLKKIYEQDNRLGFAWVMKTHFDKVINDMEENIKKPAIAKTLFKKASVPAVSEYAKQLESTCFICDRIKDTFERYVDTVLHLYKNDETFKDKYKSSKGFCTSHYGILIESAYNKLSGSVLEEFVNTTNELYIENMKRVRDDVSWFINKFDHKYFNEPWKNAKDSLPRAMTKDCSIIEDD